MQIMPESNLVQSAVGASLSLYASQSSDQFGLEMSKLLQSSDQDSLAYDEIEDDDDENDDRADSTVAAPYNPTPELISPFMPQDARLTPTEVNSIVDAMSEDGVPVSVLNAIKDARADCRRRPRSICL